MGGRVALETGQLAAEDLGLHLGVDVLVDLQVLGGFRVAVEAGGDVEGAPDLDHLGHARDVFVGDVAEPADLRADVSGEPVPGVAGIALMVRDPAVLIVLGHERVALRVLHVGDPGVHGVALGAGVLHLVEADHVADQQGPFRRGADAPVAVADQDINQDAGGGQAEKDARAGDPAHDVVHFAGEGPAVLVHDYFPPCGWSQSWLYFSLGTSWVSLPIFSAKSNFTKVGLFSLWQPAQFFASVCEAPSLTSSAHLYSLLSFL